MLRIGSQGEAVETLQSALNGWPDSSQAFLDADGIFGMKTNAKVREFQSASGLAADGIVGPLTWETLWPFVEELLNTLPKPDKDLAGQTIVAVANAALASFGWGASVVRDKNSAKIAAAICADESDPQRPRQGGQSLMSIFQIAGASGNYISRCRTISTTAVQMWQVQTAAGTGWRNSNDLPAWCGIFCYYVYRCAGFDLGGWTNHGNNVHKLKRFQIISNPKEVMKGCIGVVDGIRAGGSNHHFIVTGNEGSTISSIDGNAGAPIQGDYSQGVLSVIARRTYSYGTLKAKDAYFLFPKI
jgi:hypothetical protein